MDMTKDGNLGLYILYSFGKGGAANMRSISCLIQIATRRCMSDKDVDRVGYSIPVTYSLMPDNVNVNVVLSNLSLGMHFTYVVSCLAA